MPYNFDTTASFVIDGDEMNAGDRAFALNTRSFAFEGSEIGTAALRMFLRDHRMYAITGGAAENVAQRANHTATFAIEGRPNGEIYGEPCIFAIDGSIGARSAVSSRFANSFTIETVSQEPTP